MNFPKRWICVSRRFPQHLARLRAEGLVTTRRQGTAIYYALEDRRVLPLIEVLYDLFCTPDGFAERAGKAQAGTGQ